MSEIIIILREIFFKTLDLRGNVISVEYFCVTTQHTTGQKANGKVSNGCVERRQYKKKRISDEKKNIKSPTEK